MADNRLDGKSVLLVVPQTQFREEEVFEPQRILEKEGVRVVVASTAARTCRGMRDGVLEAVIAIEEANGEDYDAVVLAGGSSVPALCWKDKKLQELVSGMAEAAKASLLEGRKATVYFLPEALDELKNGGATYVEERVIVDGNIVMAEGPEESGRFAKAVVTALAG